MHIFLKFIATLQILNLKGNIYSLIPNNWDESLQDKFLQFLPCLEKVQLLAPVAILMAVLKTNQLALSVSSLEKVVVLDFEIMGLRQLVKNKKRWKLRCSS